MPKQPGRATTRLQVPLDDLLISSFIHVDSSPSFWFDGSGRVCIVMGCGRPIDPARADWAGTVEKIRAGTWTGTGVAATVTTQQRIDQGLPSHPGFVCDQHRAAIEERETR